VIDGSEDDGKVVQNEVYNDIAVICVQTAWMTMNTIITSCASNTNIKKIVRVQKQAFVSYPKKVTWNILHPSSNPLKSYHTNSSSHSQK
jgi:hypothetical protein